MQGVKWLFFDLGSTLINESECYRQRILEMIDGKKISYEEFYVAMLSYYKEGENGIAIAAKKFNLSLPEWKSEYEFLYSDTAYCLERLCKKYRLGIIANQNSGTKARLRAFGIDKYFDILVSSAEEGLAKPDPEIFLLALRRAKCSPEHAVMIGDRLDNDIAPAAMLGMVTVRILRGFGKFAPISSEYEKPDYTVNDLYEICSILL